MSDNCKPGTLLKTLQEPVLLFYIKSEVMSGKTYSFCNIITSSFNIYIVSQKKMLKISWNDFTYFFKGNVIIKRFTNWWLGQFHLLF